MPAATLAHGLMDDIADYVGRQDRHGIDLAGNQTCARSWRTTFARVEKPRD